VLTPVASVVAVGACIVLLAAVGAAARARPPTPVRPTAAPARSVAPTAVTAPTAIAPTAATTPRVLTARSRLAPPPTRGGALPLGYPTADATRVLTVTAPSSGNTVATLQAWTKAPAGGWVKTGSSVTAHIGAQGMTGSPSESRSATPEGSFTLTQAFGRYSNPGTNLRYFRTEPADWWISQAGPLYNTHQHCSGPCPFTQGSPNEHLYYETPYYNYAVVIDYNTRNAPGGVRQGAGSAFFLHVTDGRATAGCVAVPQATLVSIMRWLTPGAHPRILIGVV
jgi:L,D-peptidoglycan transpeptidase YkuD (ErfK/YbiS/YcfS/YnhG family)